jgi:hypothetical protein
MSQEKLVLRVPLDASPREASIREKKPEWTLVDYFFAEGRLQAWKGRASEGTGADGRRGRDSWGCQSYATEFRG